MRSPVEWILLPGSFQDGSKGSRGDDRDSLEAFQSQQILIPCDQVVCVGFDSAGQNMVVVGITRDPRDREGSRHDGGTGFEEPNRVSRILAGDGVTSGDLGESQDPLHLPEDSQRGNKVPPAISPGC